MKPQVSLGMVFGVFDGLHEGHKFFLSTALQECKELIVVVALSETVQGLKNRLPKRTFDERVSEIKSFADSVNLKLNPIAGDKVNSEWSIFNKHKPDMIFLGYDQQGIALELDRLGMSYTFVGSHHPEKYKSSLIKS